MAAEPPPECSARTIDVEHDGLPPYSVEDARRGGAGTRADEIVARVLAGLLGLGLVVAVLWGLAVTLFLLSYLVQKVDPTAPNAGLGGMDNLGAPRLRPPSLREAVATLSVCSLAMFLTGSVLALSFSLLSYALRNRWLSFRCALAIPTTLVAVLVVGTTVVLLV